MPETSIRFDDGAAYERFMGVWSRRVGEPFLDWLALPRGGRWVDVGCGNGAFTELLIERVAPSSVDGLDPAAAQIAHAIARLEGPSTRFAVGDAMALPFDDAAFDAAAMALVLHFVPDPARAVAEMARVVAPGGLVAAYTWDVVGGGFPYAGLQEAMDELGLPAARHPSAEASRLEALRALWEGAGLADVATREITVERTFESLGAFWEIARVGPPIAPRLAGLGADRHALLLERLRDRLAPHTLDDGRLALPARAHAVRGRVPT